VRSAAIDAVHAARARAITGSEGHAPTKKAHSVDHNYVQTTKNSIFRVRRVPPTFLRPKKWLFRQNPNKIGCFFGGNRKSRMFKHPIGQFNYPRKTVSHS
jgi:hypothetical protein